MKYIEYSLIVRNKLNLLKLHLSIEYGTEIAQRSINNIIQNIKTLSIFPLKGASVSSMYNVDCDYRYLYTEHYYLFYIIKNDTIIITEMFHEKEDFIHKLFSNTPLST
ncbi:MAG: type II toxin-antitoxin system RelE/ParE family toxin [Lachnospiraceae bacterium]|nr:type II toxin-antitoxin system RelE/ParE family toxin [Lachnospiraceae bacterium]